MIFDHFDRYQKAMESSLSKAIAPIGNFSVKRVEEPRDFASGQRFFVYSPFPVPGAICLEISFPLKKLLVETFFKEEWEKLSPGQIDDVLLEIAGMTGGNFITKANNINIPIRFSSPEILFTEFEEDMDNFLGDMVYFHFFVEGHPISIMLSELKRTSG